MINQCPSWVMYIFFKITSSIPLGKFQQNFNFESMALNKFSKIEVCLSENMTANGQYFLWMRKL